MPQKNRGRLRDIPTRIETHNAQECRTQCWFLFFFFFFLTQFYLNLCTGYSNFGSCGSASARLQPFFSPTPTTETALLFVIVAMVGKKWYTSPKASTENALEGFVGAGSQVNSASSKVQKLQQQAELPARENAGVS